MASTVWSGVIGFGMVSIPVKLYTATDNKRIAFHQLHAECNSRIKEIRWCPTCDREVPWDEIVKGYSLSKDEYLPITDEDFEKLPIPSKNIIDISSFTQLAEVDPLYFEKNYTLVPDKQGMRAFNLFVKALETKSLLAIGKITIRSRERMCAIRANGNTLILCTLLYQDEIRVDLNVAPADVKIPKQELDMALNLIDMMREPFDPTAYKDDYKEALTQMIEAKINGAGKKVSKVKESEPKGVVDLMEALKASVNNAGRNRAQISGKDKRVVKVTKTKTPPITAVAAKSKAKTAAPSRKGQSRK